MVHFNIGMCVVSNRVVSWNVRDVVQLGRDLVRLTMNVRFGKGSFPLARDLV